MEGRIVVLLNFIEMGEKEEEREEEMKGRGKKRMREGKEGERKGGRNG